jgi:hypothetical protein
MINESAVEQAEIAGEMQRQCKYLEELHVAIDGLRERFSRVLSSDATDQAGSGKTRGAMATVLGDELCENNARIETAIAKLNDIINRCEL